MKRHLVVVRAGSGSLHREWLGSERSWDLVVSYYGTDPDLYRDEGIRRIDHVGSKWHGLAQLFASGELDWQRYDLVWLPDDDLRTDCATIDAFLDFTQRAKAKLAQPALAWDSHCSHLITLQNRAFDCRQSTFVEIMAPCFSTAFLADVLPTFSENSSGWGLDYLWPDLLRRQREPPPLIVDRTPITHTRPVGAAGHGTGPGVSVRDELEAVLAKYGLSPAQINLAGITRNGAYLTLRRDREALIGHLLMGLIDKFGVDETLGRYIMQHALVRER